MPIQGKMPLEFGILRAKTRCFAAIWPLRWARRALPLPRLLSDNRAAILLSIAVWRHVVVSRLGTTRRNALAHTFNPKGPDMLPYVKRTTIAAVTAFSLVAMHAAPALAWGRNEQKFLQGVATAVVIGAIINDAKRSQQPQYVEPAQPKPQQVTVRSNTVGQVFNSYSRSERRAIQKSLARFGLYNGGIDGAFGRGTMNAIVEYARQEGLGGHLKSVDGTYGVLDSLIY